MYFLTNYIGRSVPGHQSFSRSSGQHKGQFHQDQSHMFRGVSSFVNKMSSSGMMNPKEYAKNVWSNKSISLMFDNYMKGMLNSVHFGPNEKIMDYGCGPGTFFTKYMSEIAKENNLKLIGVDLSEEMKNHATKNSNIPGITEYVVGNILDDKNWPFPSGTFDKIFASNVSYVVEDYQDLFRKFNSCLKIGGSFSALIPTSTILNIFNPLASHPFWSTKYSFGGSQYWASWAQMDAMKGEMPYFEFALLSAGFKISEYHHYSIQLQYEDIRECLKILITANGPLSVIPVGSELYEKLMSDLIQNAKTSLGIDVDAKPFFNACNNYWFTAEKITDF